MLNTSCLLALVMQMGGKCLAMSPFHFYSILMSLKRREPESHRAACSEQKQSKYLHFFQYSESLPAWGRQRGVSFGSLLCVLLSAPVWIHIQGTPGKSKGDKNLSLGSIFIPFKNRKPWVLRNWYALRQEGQHLLPRWQGQREPSVLRQNQSSRTQSLVCLPLKKSPAGLRMIGIFYEPRIGELSSAYFFLELRTRAFHSTDLHSRCPCPKCCDEPLACPHPLQCVWMIDNR